MIAKNRAQLKAWIKNISSKVDVNENISEILKKYLTNNFHVSRIALCHKLFMKKNVPFLVVFQKIYY